MNSVNSNFVNTYPISSNHGLRKAARICSVYHIDLRFVYQKGQTQFFAAHQRGGTYTLAMGIALRRPEWIAEGWRVVDVTFAHQNADGSLGDSFDDQATSTAFFLCWCSRALGLIEVSEYADGHRQRIEALLPKLRMACQWLARQTAALDKANAHAPNRCFIIVDAFALSSILLHDAALRIWKHYDTRRRAPSAGSHPAQSPR